VDFEIESVMVSRQEGEFLAACTWESCLRVQFGRTSTGNPQF